MTMPCPRPCEGLSVSLSVSQSTCLSVCPTTSPCVRVSGRFPGHLLSRPAGQCRADRHRPPGQPAALGAPGGHPRGRPGLSGRHQRPPDRYRHGGLGLLPDVARGAPAEAADVPQGHGRVPVTGSGTQRGVWTSRDGGGA